MNRWPRSASSARLAADSNCTGPEVLPARNTNKAGSCSRPNPTADFQRGLSMEDRHSIRRWIRFACDRNGVPELAQAVIVEWNPRFTARLGDGSYSVITMEAKIRLSIPLWPRASEKDRRETVLHEACHVITKYKFGPFVANHGPEWKTAMRTCGVEPIRTHSVDRSGLTQDSGGSSCSAARTRAWSISAA